MRITHLIRTLGLSALISVAFTSTSEAQSYVNPDIRHQSSLTEQPRLAHSSTTEISSPSLIKARSMTRIVVNQLGVSPAAVEKLMEHIDAKSLAEGGIDLTLRKLDAQSLLDEHTLNVKVNFDPRPVGGILTVRVSMTPSFRGIGVSTRPATSRSIALAVDELSEENVKQLVEELTTEIKTEFSAMQEEDSGIN